jgi:predicted nucleotidyltransferase
MSYEMTPKPQKVNGDELLKLDSYLSLIKDRLIKEFNPEQIFLFGSRASGQSHPESDYDILLVVAETKFDRYQNMDRAQRILSDLPIRAEVFVYSRSEFDSWKNELNSIPEAAYNLGVELTLGK